jgi:5,10-methylenetetrahydrofolate reductase
MTELSGVEIPKKISKRFEGVENSSEDVRKIGIEIAFGYFLIMATL